VVPMMNGLRSRPRLRKRTEVVTYGRPALGGSDPLPTTVVDSTQHQLDGQAATHPAWSLRSQRCSDQLSYRPGPQKPCAAPERRSTGSQSPLCGLLVARVRAEERLGKVVRGRLTDPGPTGNRGPGEPAPPMQLRQ
jgi:hypothetical protein